MEDIPGSVSQLTVQITNFACPVRSIVTCQYGLVWTGGHVDPLSLALNDLGTETISRTTQTHSLGDCIE